MGSIISRAGRLALATGTAIWLAGSAATAAQEPQAPDGAAALEDEIIVSGVRDQLRAIDDYVGALTVVDGNNPLPRYDPGIYCPVVLGLGPERTTPIAARMRTVAAAAGVVPAEAGCRPSALVIFVDDKERFLAAFRQQHPIYFRDVRGYRRSYSPEAGPAVAWHLVAWIDDNGNPVRRGEAAGSYMRGGRLQAMIRQAVMMSVVVVERRALLGLDVTQIADYALMRTLADRGGGRTRTARQLTILTALEAPMGSAVAASLTQWDFAYLQGRYSGDPFRYGRSQRATIRREVRRALQDGTDPTRPQ